MSTNFSFYLFILLSVTSYILVFSALSSKFIFFIITIILYSVWGFMLDLDGMILVLLTAEFTIVLLFLMTYVQLYSNFTFLVSNINYAYLSVVFFMLALYYNPLQVFLAFNNYTKSINHIVASDFYILYYFLFENFPILVVILTLVISFFSLFFIILYFGLNVTNVEGFNNQNNLYFLRNQNLNNQTNFNSELYTFQH